MTDVAQILGVGQPPATHQPSRGHQFQGMPKDLLSRITGQADPLSAPLPPVVPTVTGGKANKNEKKEGLVKVGSKWVDPKKRTRKWVWAPFSSSSRTDGAIFSHWVRGNVEYPDYPFTRFDIHLDPVTYSEDEYNRLLKSDTWTKSETDQLMELARRFELRWPVVYDRWMEAMDYMTLEQVPPDRHVEDLQHRYYHVAALLTQSRIQHEASVEVQALTANHPDPPDSWLLETAAARSLASSDPAHQPVVTTLGTGTSNKVFDLQQEKERREQMQALWNRTKAEEQEEVQLRKELSKVEAQLRKLKKKGGHIVAARSNSPVPVPTPTPRVPYLQSGRLLPPATGGPAGLNKTLLQRLDTVLQELKVPSKPMPTKRVCDLYDRVRQDILSMLILQKTILQKEGLVQSRRLKLAKLGGNVRVVQEETLLGMVPAPAPAKKAPAKRKRKDAAKSPPPTAKKAEPATKKESKKADTKKKTDPSPPKKQRKKAKQQS